MKEIKYIILCLLLLQGCQKGDEGQPSTSDEFVAIAVNSATISSGTVEVESRSETATATTNITNTTIGLFLLDEEKESHTSDNSTNLQAIESSGWSYQTSGGVSFTPTLNKEDGDLYYCAYHPYSSSYTDYTAIPLSHGTDRLYQAIGDATTEITDDADGSVELDLSLSRAMARIVFNFTLSNAQSGVTVSTITFTAQNDFAMPTSGSLNLETGNATYTTTENGTYSFSPATTLTIATGATDYTATYNAIIFPMNIETEGNVVVSFTIDGMAIESTISLPGVDLVAGSSYTLPVNIVNYSKIVAGELTKDEAWYDGDDDDMNVSI